MSEKVLNIATIGETTTLSPLYMIADNRPTQKLLYEGLVKYVDGEIQPVLAEDWELSEDGTQDVYKRQISGSGAGQRQCITVLSSFQYVSYMSEPNISSACSFFLSVQSTLV